MAVQLCHNHIDEQQVRLHISVIYATNCEIFYKSKIHSRIRLFCLFVCLFVCFDSVRPSQQRCHVGMDLPGLNQYKAEDKVSCSRTQHIFPGEG